MFSCYTPGEMRRFKPNFWASDNRPNWDWHEARRAMSYWECTGLSYPQLAIPKCTSSGLFLTHMHTMSKENSPSWSREEVLHHHPLSTSQASQPKGLAKLHLPNGAPCASAYVIGRAKTGREACSVEFLHTGKQPRNLSLTPETQTAWVYKSDKSANRAALAQKEINQRYPG